MTEAKNVTKQNPKTVQESANSDSIIQPYVDIFEDGSGITVRADMPGVAKDGLDIQIDHDSLSLTGKMNIPAAEGMEALFAEVRSARYQRSFSLSRELNKEKIEASLIDGVLTLHIPKREEHKPRKIEVRSS
jgi:HSP20 family molecular chaperone IbpA